MVMRLYIPQQEAYKRFEKGETTLEQFREEVKVDVPQFGFKTFKDLLKATKEPKRQIPQITINLTDQLKCSMDPVRVQSARRIVTLQDSPMHKNQSSYVFTNVEDLKSFTRDSRAIGENYLQKKKESKAKIVNNGDILAHNLENRQPAPLSPRIQSYRKNESSLKNSNALLSDRQTDKRFLFNVVNKEHKGNGDIIKNNFNNIVKPKQRTLLESSLRWN